MYYDNVNGILLMAVHADARTKKYSIIKAEALRSFQSRGKQTER